MKRSRMFIPILVVALLISSAAIAYAIYLPPSPPLERIPPEAYHKEGDWVKMLSTPTPEPPAPTIKPVPPEAPYIFARIPSPTYAKPGQTILINGTLTNEGKEDITLKVVPISREGYTKAGMIEPEWVLVKPEKLELKAGESKQIQIEVVIPEDADAGLYTGLIAIRPEKHPEQVVSYSIMVYRLLNEPVAEEFYVPPNSSKVIVRITWNPVYSNYYPGLERGGVSGNLTAHLYSPSGEEIPPTTISTHISGYVNAYRWTPVPIVVVPVPPGGGGGSEPGDADTGRSRGYNLNVYEQHTVLYDIDHPENGTWRLEMHPKELQYFRYTIDVNPITKG